MITTTAPNSKMVEIYRRNVATAKANEAAFAQSALEALQRKEYFRAAEMANEASRCCAIGNSLADSLAILEAGRMP